MTSTSACSSGLRTNASNSAGTPKQALSSACRHSDPRSVAAPWIRPPTSPPALIEAVMKPA
jgi:hypothetical protein